MKNTNKESSQLKNELHQLAKDQPFKTAFKMTVGFYLAQGLVTLVGLAVLFGGIILAAMVFGK